MIRKLGQNRKVTMLLFFISLSAIFFSAFYFKVLTGWSVDKAEYKLIAKTKGLVNNLTVTDWIYYFNASAASLSAPQGITIETEPISTNNYSMIKIVFQDFKGELAVVVISNVEPLSSIPLIDIPIDESSTKFSSWRPSIYGGGLENCTNFFFYLRVSAKTPMGKISINSYSNEALVKNGELQWSDLPQSKERTFTVSLWAFVFSSATISAVCLSVVSFWRKKKILQAFPIVTLLLASLMCLTYLYVGVGNDLLSYSNINSSSRFLLALLSVFFHFDYSHLMSNLLFGFLIAGSLIEVWLSRFYGLKRYLWYFSPLPFSILFSVSSVFSSGYFYVSTGASLWCIGLTIVLLLSIPTKSFRSLKNVSNVDFAALLLIGYLLFSITWGYAANFLVYYYSATSKSLFVFHILFAVLYSTIMVILKFCIFSESRKND